MFIPLGTDRPRRRPTVVTYGLIAANALVFAAHLAVMAARPAAYEPFARTLFLFPDALNPWAFFTYQFLHADLLHLLGNMLFLFVFGPQVEDRFGRLAFLAFYLVGGAFAGGVHGLTSSAPVIGASGSVAAVSGAFLVLFPLIHVRVLVFFFIIGVFAMPAWWFVLFGVVKDLFMQAAGSDGVAHGAHLGGYFFGFGVAMALLGLRLVPRETYDLFSIARHANRRRQFRELATARNPAVWKADIPRSGAPAPAAPDPAEERRAELRASIARALAAGDRTGAAQIFAGALDGSPAPVLPRDQHLLLANELFSLGAHRAAAAAYAGFLDRHRADAEAPHVRLLLALLHARYLGNRPEAARLLGELGASGVGPDHRALFDRLSAEVRG
ncbi:MAG: rhomboid family intramembrane serine protease [Phycisphaerales bacterium]|nr:rhomboid family intramembrane serine protease [Phycisphaerales bacterium]